MLQIVTSSSFISVGKQIPAIPRESVMYSLEIRTRRVDSSHSALLSVYFIEYKNIAKNNLFIRVFKYQIHNFTPRLNGMGCINRQGRGEYTSLRAHRSPPLVLTKVNL